MTDRELAMDSTIRVNASALDGMAEGVDSAGIPGLARLLRDRAKSLRSALPADPILTGANPRGDARLLADLGDTLPLDPQPLDRFDQAAAGEEGSVTG